MRHEGGNALPSQDDNQEGLRALLLNQVECGKTRVAVQAQEFQRLSGNKAW